MKIEELKPQETEEYEAFVRAHPKGHFAQSLAWARQKRSWTHTALICRNAEGEICGAMLILLRSACGLKLAYSCRGPVCSDAGILRELLRAAAQLCRTRRAVALRIDPDIPAANHGYAHILREVGFAAAKGGSVLDQTQAKFVVRLPLFGRTEEEILAAMHAKTRYNLRLSAKKGVKVRVCGEEMLPEFMRLMEETGRRDGFFTRSKAYFADILRNFGADARLYMAFWEEKAIAGAIALHYGDKTWYLYGASGNAHRDKMPNYLLQWEMIRWAVENGSRLYDFRGVPGDVPPEHPLYGLYRFKVGFGGERIEFIGEQNLVLSRFGYALWQQLLRGYRISKRLRLRLQ